MRVEELVTLRVELGLEELGEVAHALVLAIVSKQCLKYQEILGS